MSSDIIRDAREKHEHWYAAFMKSLISYNGQVEDNLAITHEECKFGQWLLEVGLKQHGDMPQMHRLARTHRELHLHVRNIIESQEMHLKTRLRFAQLEQTRDRLLAQLDELEEIFDQTEALADD